MYIIIYSNLRCCTAQEKTDTCCLLNPEIQVSTLQCCILNDLSSFPISISKRQQNEIAIKEKNVSRNVITPPPHPNPPHVKHGNMYARATQRYYPPTRPTWQHVCVCQGTLLPPHPTPTPHTSNMATCTRVPRNVITPPHVQHGNMYACARERYYPLTPPQPLHTSNMATCMRVPRNVLPLHHTPTPQRKKHKQKRKKMRFVVSRCSKLTQRALPLGQLTRDKTK